MRNDFAVFILSYGRAKNLVTLKSLKKSGYTGKIYILCSDDDKSIEEYKNLYQDKVIVFNKDEMEGSFDICDNFSNKGVVVYARNKNREIAKNLGLKYYLQLDDDYNVFEYKIRTKGMLLGRQIKNIDAIFEEFIDYLESSNASCIAFGQGGDYIGGKDNDFYTNIGRRRKIMNCFFNSVERDYQFIGRINEDTNCYIHNGKTGMLFMTIPLVSITQCTTQQNSGGLTDFYLDTGTYYKSFYTALLNPSSVKVRLMGSNYLRLHHNIDWKTAVPVIIDEKYKKKE